VKRRGCSHWRATRDHTKMIWLVVTVVNSPKLLHALVIANRPTVKWSNAYSNEGIPRSVSWATNLRESRFNPHRGKPEP
jgi:hypothetical protein